MTGGVVDCVAHGCGHVDDVDLTDALGAQSTGYAVVLAGEDHVDVVDIGIHVDMVPREIVVHEVAKRVVGVRLLVQGLTDAPDHAADDLATSRFRSHDPACGDRADYAVHAEPAEASSMRISQNTAECVARM